MLMIILASAAELESVCRLVVLLFIVYGIFSNIFERQIIIVLVLEVCRVCIVGGHL